MKFILLVSLICGLPVALRSGEPDPYAEAPLLMQTLEVPRQFESVRFFNPTTYLEMFTVEQVEKFKTKEGSLSQENASKLKTLFLEAIRTGTEKSGQSFWISKKAPMVQLLISVCPAILDLEVEPGGSLHMFEIGLVIEEERKQAYEKETGVARAPDDEIAKFYEAEIPDEPLTAAYREIVVSLARNKYGSIALPRIAQLIDEGNEDLLVALWWQHSNRSARIAILAILLGHEEAVGGLRIADFEGFATRFKEPESQMRQEEITYVKENLGAMTAHLARMTRGVERLSKLSNAYIKAATSGTK